MMTMLTDHPSADELRAYGRGRLAPEAADSVERHLAACESCCRILEEAPGDSFEGRLRAARPSDVPPELADHPRYRVLGLVGQGGMGAVYRAEHRHMERLVALKVISPALIHSPGAVERFRQEARAAARLHHPNIVTAFDADEAGGQHFLVMEYVEGRSLADLVGACGPLPVNRACAYVRQAALGLQHAHEQGMVHRDIKPHNLVVTAAGQVKVLDFGLARLARGPEDVAADTAVSAGPQTAAGAVMGTADYMAPEQAADPRKADIRADIYSLGCTLYHLLAGQPPFPQGTVRDKLDRHATEAPPRLTGVPPGLAAVLARMTARDPADRYATPLEVAEALAPFTSPAPPAPGAATPAKPVSKASGPRGRRLVLIAALAVLAAGLLAGGILVRVSTDRGDIVVATDDRSLELTVRRNGDIIRIRDPQSGQSWDVDTRNYQLAAADQPAGLVIELPGRGTLTLRRKGGGTVTVTTGPGGDTPRATAAPPRLPDPAELAGRASAADALKRAGVAREARAYVGDGDPAQAPAELVAVLGDVRLRCPGGAAEPLFSPDSKQVIVPGGPGLLLFDAVTGHLLRTVALPDLGEGKLALGPDQRTLAVPRGSGDLELWDLATGKRLRRLPMQGFTPPGGAPVFSPDGKYLAIGSLEARQARAWEVGTGRPCLTWNGPTGPAVEEGGNVVSLSFSADGGLLAVGCSDNDPYFFERTAEGRLREVAPEKRPCLAGRRLALSPDGKALAVHDYTEYKIHLCDPRGKPRFTFRCGLCDHLAFTPDGKTLVAARWAVGGRGDWSISRFDVATGKNLTDPEPLQIDQSTTWAVSPDGLTVAVVERWGNVVRLFDVTTGKQRLPGPGPSWVGLRLAFSPDGRWLVSGNSGPVQVWDLASGRAAFTWETRAAGGPMVFSRDGRMLTLLPSENEIELWGFPEGKQLQSFRGLEKRIRAVALSPDGKLLAAGGEDQAVWVWRTGDGKMERVLPQRAETEALAFSPDGRRLLAATREGALKIWDLDPGAERREPRSVEASAEVLAFLPDGQTVAGVQGDGRIWHRDGVTGELRQELDGPRAPGGDPDTDFGRLPLALAPGGQLAAAGSKSGPLVLWEPGSSPLRQRNFHLFSRGDAHVRAVAFSPDGRYLAATHPDGIICLLRLAERGRVPELPPFVPDARDAAHLASAADALRHEDIPKVARAHAGGGDAKQVPPELVAVLGDVRFRCPEYAQQPRFSPDGTLLIVPDGGDRVLLFDAATGVAVRSLGAPADEGILSPDNKVLAVSTEYTVEIWDVEAGRRLHHFLIEDPPMECCRLAFSPDGRLLAAGSGTSRQVRVWEVVSGKQRHWWDGDRGDRRKVPVEQVAFSADGKLLAAAGRYDAVRFWKVQPDGTFAETKLGDGLPAGPTPWIAFSPDGTALAAWDSDRREVRLCDVKGKLRHTLPAQEVEALTFTGDSSALVATGHEPVVRRWDVATGKTLSEASPPGVTREALCALSPDGRTLAAVGAEFESLVQMFDAATGKPHSPSPGHHREVHSLVFSPDGRLLASGGAGQVRLWDLATGKAIPSWADSLRESTPLGFSPDGRLLAIRVHDGVTLRAVADGKVIHRLHGPENAVTTVAFSPDGKLLAAGGLERTIWVWRTEDGKMERVLNQQAETDALVFSPDGRFLISVTGGQDYTYRVWDLATGEDRLAPRRVDETAYALALLPDGRTLAGVRYDGEVWLRDCLSGELKRELPAPNPYEGEVSTPMPLALGPAAWLAAKKGNAGQLFLWQPGSSPFRERAVYLGRQDGRKLTAVAFSPDGRHVAAGMAEGTIYLLRLAPRGRPPQLPARVWGPEQPQ